MTRSARSAPLPSGRPGCDETVAARLRGQGLSDAAIPALLDFDAAHFMWSRWIVKGEMLRLILARLGLDLDVAHFHALTALLRVKHGIGRAAAEPTIGLVAEELSVDPSRASRLIADLVARGHVRREVAQADGRRAVLAPTEAGQAALDAFRAEKWQIMARAFRDWDAGEIAGFTRAIRRYGEDMRAVLDDLAAEGDPQPVPGKPTGA